MSSKTNVFYTCNKGKGLSGKIRVPGDKSISHRSVMFGSLAEGTTEVTGLLEGDDVMATLRAFKSMGVQAEGPADGKLTIQGVGMKGLKQPEGEVYLGNSGTSIRLISGILAGQGFEVTMTGDASLSKRPMARVTNPLSEMGASFETAEGGRPPLKVKAVQSLKGIKYDLPMASAQVKSAVLLAGMYADGDTWVKEPAVTRDHTERMLKGFGYEIKKEGDYVGLTGGGKLKGCKIDVPSDISSAAFFMVAASICPGSDLTIEHVGMNPTRTGVIDILKLMGADIEVQNPQEIGGEPVADIRIKHAQLKGIEIPEDLVPLAIDEFPVLFVAASQADGETVLTGAEELRVKECDRIQVMADGLTELGIQNTVLEDGIRITGGQLKGGRVNSQHDHRIAMSFSVASLVTEGTVIIDDCANVKTSFPNFVELANGCGFDVVEAEENV